MRDLKYLRIEVPIWPYYVSAIFKEEFLLDCKRKGQKLTELKQMQIVSAKLKASFRFFRWSFFNLEFKIWIGS